MPGALVAMVCGLCAMRADWWRRTAVLGLLGAIGWAFGGASSYGIVIGYSTGADLLNAFYAYACLFLIGAMWGGIGGGILGLGLTMRRSGLSAAIGPLTAIYVVWIALGQFGLIDKWMGNFKQGHWLYDTYWVEATSALVVAVLYLIFLVVWRRSSTAPADEGRNDHTELPAGLRLPVRRQLLGAGAGRTCALIIMICLGWWAGITLIVGALGFHMTPPRAESWAGCLGVLIALWAYLLVTRNYASFMMGCYGFLAGGIGFAVGDFVQMLGRGRWGPIGVFEPLQGINYWTLMEQTFGFIMGIGVALAFVRLVRDRLAPPTEDDAGGILDEFSVFVIFVVMMWVNFGKDFSQALREEQLPNSYLGISTGYWALFLVLSVVALLMYALWRNRAGGLALVPSSPLGKGQWLFIGAAWLIVVGYMLPNVYNLGAGTAVNLTMFWVATAIATFLVLRLREPLPVPEAGTPACDLTWLPGWRHWVLWAAMPLLFLLLAELTLGLDLHIDHVRFPVPK